MHDEGEVEWDVSPATDIPPSESDAQVSRLERGRQRAAALQERAQQLADRAQAERGRHSSLDAAFEIADRDAEVGGGIIAGALAYRLFIWLLPFALVCVGGLGIASDAASESPKSAAGSLGLSGLVAGSLSSASSTANWYALVIGVPVLLFATRSVLRVLIGSHRLVWGQVRSAAPKPTPKATLVLLCLLLCYFLLAALASWVRVRAAGLGLVVTIGEAAGFAGLWLLLSLRLPHRDATWLDLVPGALLVGIGLDVAQVVSAYFLGPYAIQKQGTYGALGIAAAMLLALFVIGRLMVLSAEVNATLWERKQRQP
jgi:uncharacterized BrkB/YihY/UPF0761 family membrane protein